jgi:PAS domain-containing protein
MIQDLLDFQPFLNLRLTSYTLSSEEDAPHLVAEATAAGAQVVIGGAITTKIARERGIPSVLLRSGEASIRLALEEAQRIVYARRLEAHRANELKAMLEYAYEGIVAINREGRVTVFNPVAQSITGIPQQEAMGRPVDQVIPSLSFAEVHPLGRAGNGAVVHVRD